MGNLRRWSSSASGNSSVAGGANTINFAEGQAPGSVNNSAREMMAQVRGIYTPSEWGWVEFSATASVASQTTIKLTGNQTNDWTAGRRWRLKSGSSTRYGSIVSSSFTAETTITVSVDSGSLSASHSLVALAAIDSNHVPVLTSYLTSNSASSAYARLAGTNTFSVNQIIEVTDNTNAALRITQLGTGLAIRIEDETNPDSTPFSVDASGNVGIGTTALNQQFQAGNSTDQAGLYQSGNVSALYLGAPSSTAGAGVFRVRYDRAGGSAYFVTGTTSAATDAIVVNDTIFGPLKSGLGLGYSTGSGGTVTQLTSKATGVTLNKTNGQIVTAATNVGTATPQSFVVTNSTVAATDTVIVHRASGGTNASYIVGCDAVAAGSFRVYISNISGGALAEALTLNFAVIKAVTA
jgi:hypothetical protein